MEKYQPFNNLAALYPKFISFVPSDYSNKPLLLSGLNFLKLTMYTLALFLLSFISRSFESRYFQACLEGYYWFVCFCGYPVSSSATYQQVQCNHKLLVKDPVRNEVTCKGYSFSNIYSDDQGIVQFCVQWRIQNFP